MTLIKQMNLKKQKSNCSKQVL